MVSMLITKSIIFSTPDIENTFKPRNGTAMLSTQEMAQSQAWLIALTKRLRTQLFLEEVTILTHDRMSFYQRKMYFLPIYIIFLAIATW